MDQQAPHAWILLEQQNSVLGFIGFLSGGGQPVDPYGHHPSITNNLLLLIGEIM